MFSRNISDAQRYDDTNGTNQAAHGSQSIAPTGSMPIETGNHHHFSSTLTIKLGQSIFVAENIHLKLNEKPGMHLQTYQGMTGSQGMTGNQVSAALSLILINRQGEARFITTYLQQVFRSGFLHDREPQANEKLKKLKNWLVAIHELSSIHDFDEKIHAHGEQALVIELLENYQKHLNELRKGIQPEEKALALVLDICCIPGTICAVCRRSLSALLKASVWSEQVPGYLSSQNVASGEHFNWIIRVDSPAASPDTKYHYSVAEAETLTDINALDEPYIFLEQIKNYLEIKHKDQKTLLGINRLKKQLEALDMQENSLYQIILPRNARTIRAGYIFSSGTKQWQITAVQEGMAILHLLNKPGQQPSPALTRLPFEEGRKKSFPEINLPDWVHGPQQLPDDFIKAGVQNGDILVINHVQYKVMEVKNREIRSTRNNPTGKCLFVQIHLRCE